MFAFGSPLPSDPTRPITSFKTAWIKVRKEAGVKGRWHDNRHTLVTELAEGGAGDEVIMSIAGHVSRAMLSRYSHVRMEAMRRALDEIAARQRAADEKRKADPEGNPKFRAFPSYNENCSLAKTFSIRERLRTDFRAEMFNAFNRVRFGQGSLTLQSQTFGILSQTAGDQINSPRQMQLALKLYF